MANEKSKNSHWKLNVYMEIVKHTFTDKVSNVCVHFSCVSCAVVLLWSRTQDLYVRLNPRRLDHATLVRCGENIP